MSYPGGKSGAGVYQTIINQMPPHRVYIEPFAGGGAVLLHKRPAFESIALDLDSDVIARFAADAVPGLTVVVGDAISFLRGYHFDGSELVYCDPPYLMSTRADPRRRLYRYELSEEQHRDLLAVLTAIPALVMVSGYHSELYASSLSTWRTVTYRARTRGGRTVTEWLWMNFPEPTELHDYRYLGSTFRERERIKRKVGRWRQRLAAMPVLERRALHVALADLGDGCSHAS